VPTLNTYYQTSHPNIFACGDVAGIEDARVAMYEGTIVGLSVLRQLGIQRLNIDQLIKTYQEKVTQLKDAMHHKDNGYKEGPYVL
jgi:pyruvate/2-oxoglutarate dehydrogenase complex dihydrolipoamide dehydrogenase (E3) component